MKQLIRMFGVVILTMLVGGTSWAGNEGFGDPEATEAECTIIYYLAADNDQEAYADSTINQLLAGTANTANHPQVLVMIDRLSVSGTEVFEVAGGVKGERDVLNLLTYSPTDATFPRNPPAPDPGSASKIWNH